MTFQVVGPITRSTAGDQVVNPDERAVNDALHWIWSWRTQAQRLLESTVRQAEGEGLEHRRSASRCSLDEHLLLVVGRHLMRALKLARQRFEPLLAGEKASRMAKAIQLLRDLYEHWDEQRIALEGGPAPRKQRLPALKKKHPDAMPWAVSYDNGELFLGRIVPVGRLTRDLEPFENVLLRIEEERGHRPTPGGESMAKSKTTGRSAARAASKTLASPATGKTSKSAAGSALSQTKAPKKVTSKPAATAAAKVLRDGRTSKASKAAAGSALAQKPAKKPRAAK